MSASPPPDTFSLNLRLPVEAASARLSENISHLPYFPFGMPFLDRKTFIGKNYGTRFTIYRYKWYSNGLKPMLYGTFTPTRSGHCQLQARFQIHPLVKGILMSLMLLFLVMLIMCMIYLFSQAVEGVPFPLEAMFSAGVSLYLVLFTVGVIWWGIRISKPEKQELYDFIHTLYQDVREP